jgi:uncharacterized protein
MRVVVDTNIFVRAFINPSGSVAPVVDRLTNGEYVPLYSSASLAELVNVLSRPRIQTKYHIRDTEIADLLELLGKFGEQIESERSLAICRDPKDDKFLVIAAAGKADVIVSGDADLLVLSPFEGIPIVGSATLLRMLAVE